MIDQAVASMTIDEAREATERIRLSLDRVAAEWADLADRIADAYQRRADLALGYSSWAEYAEAELRPSHSLSVDIRRELVGLLSATGMSTRAIGPTVGVTRQAVSKIQHREVATKLPPAVDPIPTGSTLISNEGVVIAQTERIDLATGEVFDERSTPITGLDGKTYTRTEPAPAKARRTPLPETAIDAARKLTSAVERIERVFDDDRLPQNAEQVARLTRNHLSKAIETCQRLMEKIPN